MLYRIRGPDNKASILSTQAIPQRIEINRSAAENLADLTQRVLSGPEINYYGNTVIMGQWEPGITGRGGSIFADKSPVPK